MAVRAQLLLLVSLFCSALIVPGFDGYYRAHPLEKLGFRPFIMQSSHCHQPWNGKQITKRPRGEKDFYRFPQDKLWRTKRFDEAQIQAALEALTSTEERRSSEVGENLRQMLTEYFKLQTRLKRTEREELSLAGAARKEKEYFLLKSVDNSSEKEAALQN